MFGFRKNNVFVYYMNWKSMIAYIDFANKHNKVINVNV